MFGNNEGDSSLEENLLIEAFRFSSIWMKQVFQGEVCSTFCFNRGNIELFLLFLR